MIPKFLSEEDPSWREDFFAIASLARYGHILPAERLLASAAAKNTLADLIGRSVVNLYERNRHRPIRVYRSRSWSDFDINGEIEPESAISPSEEGFVQHGALFDRRNGYGFVIRRAVSMLQTKVNDGDLRHQLSETELQLSPQDRYLKRKPPRFVPPRHRQWQDLYDLCRSYAEGFALGLRDKDNLMAPGFILRTAEAWESLLILAARVSLPTHRVAKVSYKFGSRHDARDEASEVLLVTPDITISLDAQLRFLVDAKYKGRVADSGSAKIQISSADIYEGKAFLDSCGAKELTLVYPVYMPQMPTGATAVLEEVHIGDYRIIAIGINPTGISLQGGVKQFADGLARGLSEGVERVGR